MNLKLCLTTFWLILIWMYVTEAASQFLIASTEWSNLYSPNYPNTYPNNADEVYELLARDYNNLVCIKMVTFDLERTSDCNADYVAVQFSMTSDPIGHWCGSYMPHTCSENGVMYIRFRSDNNSVTGNGFRLLFREEYREGSVPVSMILGMAVIPLTILVILVFFCFGRRKKRFNRPRGQETEANRGSSTPTPETSCTVASISHSPGFNVNCLGPPSYESAVTNGINDLPPSYESLVNQEDKNG